MMTSFVNLPSMSQSLIGVLEVTIFLTTAAIIVTEVKHKHWKGLIYLIPIGISLYFASQCVFYIRSDIPIYGSTKAIVDTYGELPWPAIIGVLLIIAALEIRVFRHNRKWIREHITATSIKEAIDNLPVGICEKVLSTRSLAPLAWAIFANSGTFAIRSSGLFIVSV